MFFKERSWWRRALAASLLCAPGCILPAFCLGAANVVMLVGMRQLYQLLNLQEITIQQFTQGSAQGCWSILAAFLLMSFGLAAWLMRLTAFARAWLARGDDFQKARLSSSFAEVKEKKWYFCKLWSIASLYLLVPLFPFSLLSTIKVISSPGYALGGAPDISISGGSLVAVNVVLLLIAALMVSYSLVVLVFSAGRLASPGQTAWSAVKEMLKRPLPVLLAGVLVMVVDGLVCAPQSVLSSGSVEEMVKLNIFEVAAWQLWFIVSSSIVWPWSIIVFCDLVGSQGRD